MGCFVFFCCTFKAGPLIIQCERLLIFVKREVACGWAMEEREKGEESIMTVAVNQAVPASLSLSLPFPLFFPFPSLPLSFTVSWLPLCPLLFVYLDTYLHFLSPSPLPLMVSLPPSPLRIAVNSGSSGRGSSHGRVLKLRHTSAVSCP